MELPLTEAEVKTVTNFMHTLIYEMDNVWVSDEIRRIYSKLYEMEKSK